MLCLVLTVVGPCDHLTCSHVMKYFVTVKKLSFIFKVAKIVLRSVSSSFFFLASACTKPSSTAWSQWSTLSSLQGSRGKKNHFREYPAPNIAFCKRFPLLRYNKYFLNILNKICQFMNKFSTRLDMPAIPKILRTHVTARLHVSLFILFLQRK